MIAAALIETVNVPRGYKLKAVDHDTAKLTHAKSGTEATICFSATTPGTDRRKALQTFIDGCTSRRAAASKGGAWQGWGN